MSKEYTSQIKIDSIILKDELGNELIDFSKVNVSGINGVGTLEIIESIAETSVRGVITVSSTRGEFEALKLVGNETIQFSMSTPSNNREEEDYFITTPEFKVYDFDESSDFSDTSLNPEGVASRIITLKFSSKQEADAFSVQTPFPRGFVGKIALDQSNVESSEESTEQLALSLDDDEKSEEEEQTEEPILGLINEIANTYFFNEKFYIEGTDNSVVLSPKKFTLPNKKVVKNMNLLQLINYCTKYAWKSSNEIKLDEGEELNGVSDAESAYGWANYFFWQDLEGWNFRSIVSLAEKAKSKGVKVFTFTDNMLAENRLMKLDPISDFTINKAFSDGLMYSYYDRVEPNYENKYSRFLDEGEKYKETRYSFNYGSDYSPIIGNSKFLPDKMFDEIDGTSKPLSEWILNRSNDENMRRDNLFGYYKDRQYNDKSDLYPLLGRGVDKLAKNENDELPDTTNPELADYHYYQNGIFQEMFDCVDVMGSYNAGVCADTEPTYTDASVLTKLHKIKGDTFRAKNNYKRALTYKEQWNVYRYSVCCEENVAEGTEVFAIIKDHYKIADNIYRYEWAEVALMPKAELGFMVGFGFTYDSATEGISSDEDIYKSDVFSNFTSPEQVDGLNSFYLQDPDSKIYWSAHVQDFSTSYITNARFGYWSGTIYFHPVFFDDEIYEGVTGSVSWPNVNNLFQGVSAEGLTLTFHNSQHSPFLVIEKPNSVRGSTGNYSGAYNLNEIMNRNLLNETTYEAKGFTGINESGALSTVYYQRSKIDGTESGDNIYAGQDFTEPVFDQEHLVGPGINANSDTTGYPSGFDMMPIGGYKPNGDENKVACSAVAYGHIVRMSSVSYDDAMQVGIEPRDYPVEVEDKRLFYFSLANAHDGNCEGDCDL